MSGLSLLDPANQARKGDRVDGPGRAEILRVQARFDEHRCQRRAQRRRCVQPEHLKFQIGVLGDPGELRDQRLRPTEAESVEHDQNAHHRPGSALRLRGNVGFLSADVPEQPV